MIKTELIATTAERRTYWYAPTAPGRRLSRSCHLLPAFDEYTVAYNDRSAALSDEDASRPESGHGILYPTIVIDGQIAGTWSRVLKKASVVIAPKPFRKLDRTELQALTLAARRYADYLELPQAQRFE